MYAASALTGRRVETPPALAALRGVSGLVTDARQIAYPSTAFRSLWWSPSLQVKPTEILSARGVVNHVDNSVQVGGHYVGFGVQPQLFLANTDTHRYVEIGNQLGHTELNARALLVEYGENTKKQANFRPHVALIPLRALPPIPACGT